MSGQQLRLIESTADTHIDERTKAIGRAGLAKARSAIAEANRRRAAREETGRPWHPTAA